MSRLWVRWDAEADLFVIDGMRGEVARATSLEDALYALRLIEAEAS